MNVCLARANIKGQTAHAAIIVCGISAQAGLASGRAIGHHGALQP
jgi:hypothetical protein